MVVVREPVYTVERVIKYVKFDVVEVQWLREERRFHRRENEIFQEMFSPAKYYVTEDAEFDFAGIRWMHDGRWGQEHPIYNWDHPAHSIGLMAFYGLW